MATFITHFGYYVPIDRITPQITNELTVSPHMMDATKDAVERSKFSLYRYTKDRQYVIVPRYYGISKFGAPQRTTLNEAEQINVPFTNELRQNQQIIVDKCIKHIKTCGGGILSVPCGYGKCLAKGTKLLMYDGTIKHVEHVRIGDMLMGDDSMPRLVMSTTFGVEKMYRIRDRTTNEFYDVNQSHILSLKNNTNDIVDISVYDVLHNWDKYGKLQGYRTRIEWQHKHVTCDPYTMGQMLLVNDMEAIKLANDIDSCIINSSEVRERMLDGVVKGYTNITVNVPYPLYANKLRFLARSLGYFSMLTFVNGSFCVHIDKSMDIKYKFVIQYIGVGDYYGFEIDGNGRFVMDDFTVTHNTVCALYIAKTLGVKTLVVVHKTFLLNQWLDRASEFLGLTKDKMGVIRQNKCEVDGKDLVVGIIHTLSKKTYRDVFNKFGFVIYDEAHHVSCKFFSRALMKTGAKYTLALTATPYRTDGLIRVMYWFCGDMIHHEKMQIDKNVIVKIIKHKASDNKFELKKKWAIGQMRPDTGKMITNMCKISTRNYTIVEIIDYIRKTQPKRKILVLSGRKFQLVELKKNIDAMIQIDIDCGTMEKSEFYTGFYTGDSTQVERQIAEERGDIIFATYDMAHEGLDIKHMNTVILASPKKDVVQSIGRIMRTILKHGDTKPLIVDIYDDIECLRNWGNRRLAMYKQREYAVDTHHLIDNKFVAYDTYNNMCMHKNICKLLIYDKNECDTYDRDVERFYKLLGKNSVRIMDTHDKTSLGYIMRVDNVQYCIPKQKLIGSIFRKKNEK